MKIGEKNSLIRFLLGEKGSIKAENRREFAFPAVLHFILHIFTFKTLWLTRMLVDTFLGYFLCSSNRIQQFYLNHVDWSKYESGQARSFDFGKNYNFKKIHCVETLVKELNIQANIFQVYCMR